MHFLVLKRTNSPRMRCGGRNILTGSRIVDIYFDHVMLPTGFHRGKEPRRRGFRAKIALYLWWVSMKKTVLYQAYSFLVSFQSTWCYASVRRRICHAEDYKVICASPRSRNRAILLIRVVASWSRQPLRPNIWCDPHSRRAACNYRHAAVARLCVPLFLYIWRGGRVLPTTIWSTFQSFLWSLSNSYNRACNSCISTGWLIGTLFRLYFFYDWLWFRDCTQMNIMMDASGLSIDAFHPVDPLMKRDFSGYARFRKRTQRPPKYYFIDFGLSRRYDPSLTKPLEIPIWGGDKGVPEFQGSNEPRDPFATDVFYLGNAIRTQFLEVIILSFIVLCRVLKRNPEISWVWIFAITDCRYGWNRSIQTAVDGWGRQAVWGY